MTDEWIVEKAKEAGKREGVFSDLVHSPKSRGVNSAYGIGFIDGMVEYRESLWHKANDPNDLPEIDREVIALQGMEGGGHRIVFAHRPVESYIGKDIFTGKKTKRFPKRYGKGQWNMENVEWWLDVDLPKNVKNDWLFRTK